MRRSRVVVIVLDFGLAARVLLKMMGNLGGCGSHAWYI